MAPFYPAVMTSYGAVQRAVRAQLRRLGLSPASSAEAAVCVALAARLDSTEGAAAAAVCARELRAVLAAVATAAAAVEERKGREVAAIVGWDPGNDPQLRDLAAELAREYPLALSGSSLKG